MRGVVANSCTRVLGLAPTNEELDNTVTVFLLEPGATLAGRGRDGEPTYQVRTGLSYHNSYGAGAVRPVNRKNERADLNIAEDSRAAFFARKFWRHYCWFPTWEQILAHLDVANLNLSEGGAQHDKPILTTDEGFLGSSLDGMRKRYTIAALVFRKT